MKIYAPVTDVNGIWCTVKFVNGVGETDNPSLINWFKDHGYRVEETASEVYAIGNNPEELLTNVL